MKVRPLYKFSGSKTWMVPTLMRMVPPETRVLVSPFLGSGVFEMEWAREHPECKVVASDNDDNVVNFHRCAREDGHRLYALTSDLALFHPFTMERTRYEELVHELRTELPSDADTTVQFHRAAHFWLVMHHSFNGLFGKYIRKGAKYNAPIELLNYPQNIVVHKRDAIEAIDAAPEEHALVYADPPYRVPTAHYRLGNRGFPHEDLALAMHRLHEKGGRFILSYNDVIETRRLYESYTTIIRTTKETHVLNSHQRTRLTVDKGELLVSNY
jgi:site-specific DNA-adenine methylase